MMSGIDLFWNMRLSVVSVSIHSHGRISAIQEEPATVTRVASPLNSRVLPSPSVSVTVTALPSRASTSRSSCSLAMSSVNRNGFETASRPLKPHSSSLSVPSGVVTFSEAFESEYPLMPVPLRFRPGAA